MTICPVNNMPDLIYCSVEHDNQFVELYKARKLMATVVSAHRCAFMEVIADALMRAFPDASAVEVRLAFNRHIVRITRGE